MKNETKALEAHAYWAGKIEMVPRVEVNNNEDLSIAYTPGVAEPCLEIQKDITKSYLYTRRWNTVAVITDGTAVLGLGDIGPEAGMPVMEGKCVLFKTFGAVDAIPLCIRSRDTDEIVRTISLLAGSFGGVNLEDIAAPRCFEIEKKLKEVCDIPIFHDDQHGTAIVVGAALLNALKIVGKSIKEIKVVINGAGAAGVSIANFLLRMGVTNMIVCDRFGAIYDGLETENIAHWELSKKTNGEKIRGLLEDVIKGADVFIGVSGPNCLTKTMIKTMNSKAIVFPLANPIPEISREDALAAGALIVGTGSSKNPNQINNVLAFPGIFRGTLDAHALDITFDMMLAASLAIASCVKDDELNVDYIIPYAFNKDVHLAVAEAVKTVAISKK